MEHPVDVRAVPPPQPPTLDELYEIFEMRSVLEGLAVRLAMPRIGEDELDEIERLLDRMERAGQSGSTDWVIRHQEFHGRIVALSQRPKLTHQISALHVVIEPYMRLWFDFVDKPLSAREEHEAVIAALRSGDARHAELVMQEHILGTAPMLADFVTSEGR